MKYIVFSFILFKLRDYTSGICVGKLWGRAEFDVYLNWTELEPLLVLDKIQERLDALRL